MSENPFTIVSGRWFQPFQDLRTEDLKVLTIKDQLNWANNSVATSYPIYKGMVGEIVLNSYGEFLPSNLADWEILEIIVYCLILDLR